MILILFRNNANINAYDDDGIPALFYAVEHGNIETVNVLLKNHALIDICDNNNHHIDHYIQQVDDKRPKIY